MTPIDLPEPTPLHAHRCPACGRPAPDGLTVCDCGRTLTEPTVREASA